MEVAVDGSGSNGVFAATVNADEGMVAAASPTASHLTTTTTIAAITIGKKCHLR
jgi:hypothetical protein